MSRGQDLARNRRRRGWRQSCPQWRSRAFTGNTVSEPEPQEAGAGPGTPAASVGQGLTALGAKRGSWAVGRVRGGSGGWAGAVRAGGALRVMARSSNFSGGSVIVCEASQSSFIKVQ